MDRYFEKLLILLCGLFLLLSSGIQISDVFLFLITLCLLSLDEVIHFQGYVKWMLLFCCVLSIFLPNTCFFLPCMLYLLLEYKRTPWGFSILLPLIIKLSRFGDPVSFGLLVLFSALAALLSDHYRQLSALSTDYNRLRDTDHETVLSLKKRTDDLLEEQDSNIRIATLQERTRIAREMHDTVGHLLSRSLLMVGAMLTVNKEDESLILLKESLDSAMDGIRKSVHDLRDEGVELESSAKLLLADCKGYQTSLTYEIKQAPPAAVTYCFLAILKEAISNTIKHSNGDSVSVKIQEFTSLYYLSVADNGTNAKLESDDSGMGLENMRVRATALNGTVRFSVNEGFHIFVSIPKED